MLETAQRKINRRGLANVSLARALAEEMDYVKTFRLDAPFDAIFFFLYPDHDPALASGLGVRLGKSET